MVVKDLRRIPMDQHKDPPCFVFAEHIIHDVGQVWFTTCLYIGDNFLEPHILKDWGPIVYMVRGSMN